MGLMAMKKITLLFLLISASLCSTSFAGREWRFVDKPAMDVSATNKEISSSKSFWLQNDDEVITTADEVHERLLRVNTKDYGRYDPSPTLVKPPFKLIPN
ncbi:hypothetical protein BVC80_857g45 [Macleaya cordata]|uniref:Organ specific protein n=1 Tax=Macleaya cordata TaxID=56857 RepID=A0A200Q6U1_MACCD|nr:hypothetical protein BVC80_857g45 [Macleaya cordata]